MPAPPSTPALSPTSPPAVPNLVAPVPMPPAAPAPVAVSPAALRAALQAVTGVVSCAQLHGDVANNGHTTLSGLAGRDSEQTLRRLVGDAVERAPLAWHVTAFDGPFCKTLDTLRPAARRFGIVAPDVQLALKDGPFKLHENDNIVPRFIMPDYPGYAQLSYLTGDGTLVHLYPSNEARQIDIIAPDGQRQAHRVAGMDFRQFPAGATIAIADPETCRCKPQEVGWQVAPPFGTDMMLIAVSSQPLFAQRRPANDTVETYLRDLQAALGAAMRRGVRVNTRAILVETEPR